MTSNNWWIVCLFLYFLDCPQTLVDAAHTMPTSALELLNVPLNASLQSSGLPCFSVLEKGWSLSGFCARALESPVETEALIWPNLIGCAHSWFIHNINVLPWNLDLPLCMTIRYSYCLCISCKHGCFPKALKLLEWKHWLFWVLALRRPLSHNATSLFPHLTCFYDIWKKMLLVSLKLKYL